MGSEEEGKAEASSLVPGAISKEKKLENCKAFSGVKYNSKLNEFKLIYITVICDIVMYCDLGKMIMTDLETDDMSYY